MNSIEKERWTNVACSSKSNVQRWKTASFNHGGGQFDVYSMPRCSQKYAWNSVETLALWQRIGNRAKHASTDKHTGEPCIRVEENDFAHESYLYRVSIPFIRNTAGWFSDTPSTFASSFSVYVLAKPNSFIGFATEHQGNNSEFVLPILDFPAIQYIYIPSEKSHLFALKRSRREIWLVKVRLVGETSGDQLTEDSLPWTDWSRYLIGVFAGRCWSNSTSTRFFR